MIGQAQASTAAVYQITRQRIYIFIYINQSKHKFKKGHFGHDKTTNRKTRDIITIQKVQLPDPSFEEQITIAFQTNTSLKEAFKSIALPIETIDDLGT